MVQRYNILGRYTNQYPCLCSHAGFVVLAGPVVGIVLNERLLVLGGRRYSHFSKYIQVRISHAIGEVIRLPSSDG